MSRKEHQLARFWRDTHDRVLSAQRVQLQVVAVRRPALFFVVSAVKGIVWDLPCWLVRRIAAVIAVGRRS